MFSFVFLQYFKRAEHVVSGLEPLDDRLGFVEPDASALPALGRAMPIVVDGPAAALKAEARCPQTRGIHAIAGGGGRAPSIRRAP